MVNNSKTAVEPGTNGKKYPRIEPIDFVGPIGIPLSGCHRGPPTWDIAIARALASITEAS